mmetsp:Transcript_25827/g.28533  ORF Transcript_25827/g.28533 Transcript_25827/m.28533 type:complete len:504 (+) Transcript_25827:1-1512(+)|eukprot:CAMPEP_0194160512 /NCGR_PEP_ID=MMETSP0152-20130528/78433_1 /TAXON_ID=1049557 /ORGANISM="Thalassiothrix antarctica, Strain L6-D1" /LENGTH=503 /DNA_ID=CAMNT_0038870211 /DNA_START=2244 /DNA_END=3755 /DNA_ORIENTATION=+
MNDLRSMSIIHASRLLNGAIVIMQNLGWAWRWAEWWVTHGSNWEPLIEDGQDESKMSREQLKIIDSTQKSRCMDARACRLAAFSAALRNRAYDAKEDGPTILLDRALRAVLATESLVGPLEEAEIKHCALWLGIAYRSKSRLLGYGKDKIPISESFRLCLHVEDKSPKFELGSRRLPGRQELPPGQIFETDFHDIDDFLKPEILDDGSIFDEEVFTKRSGIKRKKLEDKKSVSPLKERKRQASKKQLVESDSMVLPKRGPGRPRKEVIEEPISSVLTAKIPKVQTTEQDITSPKMLRKTRNKKDTMNGWDSKCNTAVSFLAQNYSASNSEYRVLNGNVEVSTRMKRRSAPTQFLIESEEEEEQELVMYDPIQDSRKRKHTGTTCHRKTKIANDGKSTVPRSYTDSGLDQEKVSSTKKNIFRQRTRGGGGRRRNKKIDGMVDFDDEYALESQEDYIIKTDTKPIVDCVIPHKAPMDVLTSSFQIPRKKKLQKRDVTSTMEKEIV